MHIIEVSCY